MLNLDFDHDHGHGTKWDGTERKVTFTRQERNFHCIVISNDCKSFKVLKHLNLSLLKNIY